MKGSVLVLIAAVAVLVAGVGLYFATSGGGDDPSPVEPEGDDMNLILAVDGKRVDVVWEDNPSVSALKGMAKDVITISMERYGGFEQTGSMGSSIVSDDSWMQVGPGDVVLYRGIQICLYFDDNSYNFTRLGKITGMSEEEIRSMLDRPSVTATLSLE